MNGVHRYKTKSLKIKGMDMLTNSQHPCYIQMCEYSCIQISNTQKSLIGYTWGRS